MSIDLDVEKLRGEVERLKKELKKKKKYGLVWEEKPEEVVEMCKEKLPVLKEVKEKEIITDKEKPVNLLIEGDNYHALSVLNYTHAKKVDVIYIDPPYNTGNKDFIFNDRYVDKEDAYRHSKWLSFMEKRLKLAKNLLKDTGVIFISIDDNELAQLKLLMDNPDLFGEEIFITSFIWKKKGTSTNVEGVQVSSLTEYILCYGRTRSAKLLPRIRLKETRTYPFKDEEGIYRTTIIEKKNVGSYARTSMQFNILGKPPREGKRWQIGEKRARELEAKGRFIIENDVLKLKIYDFEDEDTFSAQPNLLDDCGSTQNAQQILDEILGRKGLFENPKPKELIKRLINFTLGNNSIILDFMAGTGTTAHAVLELNREEGCDRKFILCTNNEDNNGNGYKIAKDICYPRIKKVIEGYKNLKGEKVKGLGGNLKYFRTDFVDAEPTDKNKIMLTKQATEMLCVKEGTFEPIRDGEDFKIFKNSSHYTGIIWDQDSISAFKRVIKGIDGKFSVYVFSLGDETFGEEFEDIKQKVQLSPIPEAILRVYRRIFK